MRQQRVREVRLVKWRQSLLLLVGALAFCIVGVLWTLTPFVAIGGLLLVIAAMAAFLRPLDLRG